MFAKAANLCYDKFQMYLGKISGKVVGIIVHRNLLVRTDTIILEKS